MSLGLKPGSIVSFIVLLLVVICINNWYEGPQGRHYRPTRPATASAAAPSHPTPHVRPSDGDLSDPDRIIASVSATYDVPAGLLYGVWRKESGGLRHGWGTSPSWHVPSELVAPGGRCVREYDQAKCDRHYRALQAICSQQRGGRPICDPRTMRTSYALAMGPMQLMPETVLRTTADGTGTWTTFAVDYDGDGVVDPLSLPDAMAMSARFLRHFYETKRGEMGELEAWQWAANRYYGSQSAGYFEGTTGGRLGIIDHWRQWCETHGTCRSRELLASN
jgi:hypothetical protein